MREILFRGVVKSTNEWIYGYYNQWDDNKPKISGRFHGKEDNLFVIPETIGQYTGLCDKNGTKIFEGDILRNEKGICFRGEYTAKVEYSIAFGKYYAVGNVTEFEASDFHFLEVIGNIHDNPELLGV